MAGCPTNKQWCSGLSAMMVILGLIVTLAGLFVGIQERRIVQLEEKNDTIVEMRTDMKYLKNDVAEIKILLKTRP